MIMTAEGWIVFEINDDEIEEKKKFLKEKYPDKNDNIINECVEEEIWEDFSNWKYSLKGFIDDNFILERRE